MQQKIYIYKEYDLGKHSSISEQREAGSSCIEGGQAYGQAPRLLRILERVGRAEDWLGKVSALLFSTCRVFMALAKAHEAAEGPKVLEEASRSLKTKRVGGVR